MILKCLKQEYDIILLEAWDFLCDHWITLSFWRLYCTHQKSCIYCFQRRFEKICLFCILEHHQPNRMFLFGQYVGCHNSGGGLCYGKWSSHKLLWAFLDLPGNFLCCCCCQYLQPGNLAKELVYYNHETGNWYFHYGG